MAAEDEAGTWRPTVAGVLMACRAPEEFLSCAFIQAVAYRGDDVVPQADQVYQRDAADLTGPLDRQIFDACAFVRKNMRVAARKRLEGGREDLPQFDLLAVFEALANAVAHRDYSMYGSKVRLRLFDNRLELYVPGMLANSMTPERLPHRQVARNETVTSLLARCRMEDVGFPLHRTHIMDKRGDGVPAILSRTFDLAGEFPVYRMLDDAGASAGDSGSVVLVMGRGLADTASPPWLAQRPAPKRGGPMASTTTPHSHHRSVRKARRGPRCLRGRGTASGHPRNGRALSPSIGARRAWRHALRRARLAARSLAGRPQLATLPNGLVPVNSARFQDFAPVPASARFP